MKRMMYMPLGFAVLCLAGCRQEQTDRRETLPPVKVKTMQVTTSTTAEEEHRYSGTIEETAGTPLSFPVMGTVSEVHFKVGDRVGKGQLLATLDPTSMQSSLDAAQATLAQAEDAYARMKELHDKGSLAEIKWVEVQSKLRQARSMEELARKNRNDCNLYAPFGGVMADKSIEVGQNVLPGVSVGKIVGVGKLKVKIAVPENEITRIALQQRAEIRLMTPGGGIFHGAVSEKGIVANPLSRSYEVKLTLDDAAPSLMPGPNARHGGRSNLRKPGETAAVCHPGMACPVGRTEPFIRMGQPKRQSEEAFRHNRHLYRPRCNSRRGAFGRR